jgi:hypothetical protein
MGLDGHQAPPIPRPSDSAKTPSVHIFPQPITASSLDVSSWHLATTADQTLCLLLVKADASLHLLP